MYLEWRWGPAGGALSTLVLLVNPRPNRKTGMVYVDSTLLSQKEEERLTSFPGKSSTNERLS